MADESLKYLSRQVAENLLLSVDKNIDRYREGDFQDLCDQGGWSIELTQKADLTPLKELVLRKDADAEIENSILVWRALSNISPALASENRFWTRLTHMECLEFSRFRWLDLSESDEALAKSVRTHFFANTRTRYRDDNAVSRLWWNAYIAKLASPGDQEKGLRMILKTADIRNNFIERIRTVSRPVIAAAILRIMSTESWLTEKEKNFRDFMITLNRMGGGKAFELWDEPRINEFMSVCVARAKKSVSASA